MTESMIEKPSEQVADRLEELRRDTGRQSIRPSSEATVNEPGSKFNSGKKRPWQEVVADKVAIRDALIQAHHQSNMAKEDADIILIDDVNTLTKKLHAGEFTAEEVVRAYIKRSVNSLILSDLRWS